MNKTFNLLEVMNIPKLYFRYGAMGSSKTANALMTKFNYEEKGYKVLLLKPSIDDRYGETVVKSRIGLSSEAKQFRKSDNLRFVHYGMKPDIIEYDAIIVDEGQFCTARQIEQLKQIATVEIPVFVYGLRTNFKSELFEGSKRLFEIADSITEIKSICSCGSKAIINARLNDGMIVREGEEIEIGGNEKYIGMCYSCWKGELCDI